MNCSNACIHTVSQDSV